VAERQLAICFACLYIKGHKASQSYTVYETKSLFWLKSASRESLEDFERKLHFADHLSQRLVTFTVQNNLSSG